MAWRKLGLVYVPSGEWWWARSHAMLPTPVKLRSGRIRVYFASTDESMVGRVGYIELSHDDPTHVVEIASEPVLDIGMPGTFDDNGVNPCHIVELDDHMRLYYVGYQLHQKVPYTLFTGLAISTDQGRSFTRHQRTPILDRTESELFFRTAPFVCKEETGWRMWYIGGGSWLQSSSGKTLPTYSLYHADSCDGTHWQNPRKCMSPNLPHEIGFGRPFLLKEQGIYRMWYSIRTERGYSLGYAESPDGLSWNRLDSDVGIRRSESGFDADMICYSAIMRTGAHLLMFYNGNGYGRTGIGAAIWDEQ